MVTATPGVALAVLGADCLPVVLWRRDTPRVAAAHAGWRGLVAGVLEATARALGAPGDAGAAIGPGIGPCCYPVSDEVRGASPRASARASWSGEAVDLAAAARGPSWRPASPTRPSSRWAPAPPARPSASTRYRRDGAGTGRQAGLVWAAAA